MNEIYEGERNPCKVFLVDDHPIVREGLRLLLSESIRIGEGGSFSIVGEARSGEEALPLIKKLKPGLLVTDVILGEEGMSGLELTRRVKEEWPDTYVLIFSAYGDPYYVREALKAGAGGYVLKGNGGQNLGDAVRAVLEGGRYLDPDLDWA